MKRLSIIALIAKLTALLLCLSGCTDSTTPDSAPAFDAGYLRAQISVIDADDSTWVPDLPDDFKKQGLTPTPETQPLPPPKETVEPPKPPEVVPVPPLPGGAGNDTQGGSGVSSAPPVVYYYCKPRCVPCDNFMADSKAMGDFQFVKGQPDAWSLTRITGWPYFRWQIGGNWVGETNGWTGPAAFREAFKRLAAGGSTTLPSGNSRAGNAPAALKRHGVFYGQRPSQWNWPGELRHHLTQPPHNYPRSRVDAMSDQEVIRAHDAWHNKYGTHESQSEWNKTFQYWGIRPTAANCPT